MTSIIHLVLLQAAIGAAQPPLPHDWSTLPQLKHTEQPEFSARLTRFVMREQRNGRCNVPVADDGQREINVEVAVLVAPDGEILETVPADVNCPSVETYTADTIRRISEGIAVAGPGPEPNWFRTRILYSW